VFVGAETDAVYAAGLRESPSRTRNSGLATARRLQCRTTPVSGPPGWWVALTGRRHAGCRRRHTDRVPPLRLMFESGDADA